MIEFYRRTQEGMTYTDRQEGRIEEVIKEAYEAGYISLKERKYLLEYIEGSFNSGTFIDNHHLKYKFGTKGINPGEYWGSRSYEECHPSISPTTADNYNAGRIGLVRRDPLVLDLDGDGIETVGPAANIMFDHDGDGNLNGTGWVKADDGFLVLDRNANGTIDNGSELFGVDTVLSSGQHATDGFNALSDLDTNSDGVFSSADAQFANVRIWRDLNQDGVSQAGELMSLADAGIASINLNATTSGSTQGNGNVVVLTSTYTRTDSTTGTAGSLDFGQDTFNSSFSDYIEPTEETADLPFMYGSGQVRDSFIIMNVTP